MSESIYSQLRKISIPHLFSFDVYKVKPAGIDKKHYHNIFEVVYVAKGNCRTHKQYHFYFYRKGHIHEVINDSNHELVICCLTIPPESEKNTVYIN